MSVKIERREKREKKRGKAKRREKKRYGSESQVSSGTGPFQGHGDLRL